eukprot:COSAG05_NODE_893_length_6708_cov_2.153427_7_plen_307_part_00
MGRVFYHAAGGAKATRAAARVESLQARLDAMKENSLILNGSHGFDQHKRATTNYRVNQTRARRERRKADRVSREEDEVSTYGKAMLAASMGSEGWKMLAEQERREVEEAEEEASRAAAKAAAQAEMGVDSSNDDTGSDDDFADLRPKVRRQPVAEPVDVDHAWEEYLRASGDTGVKAVLSSPDVTPGWSTHPYRPAEGPVGGVRSAYQGPKTVRKTQYSRSYSRAAVESLVQAHAQAHPHNTPMPNGYHDDRYEQWHAEQVTAPPFHPASTYLVILCYLVLSSHCDACGEHRSRRRWRASNYDTRA